MAFNPNIAINPNNTLPKPEERASLAQILAERQRMRIEDQAATDASNAALNASNKSVQGLAFDAQEQPDRAGLLHSQAEGESLGLAGKREAAQEAGIGSGYLSQMFPGQNLPPYLQRPQDAQQQPQAPGTLPPYLQRPQDQQATPEQAQAGNQLESKSLAELRQIKANAGPMGAFIGKFVDPMIAQKSNAEELAPALQAIASVASMPGASHEQARAKSAALAAVVAKYPMVAGDPRLKEAISTAMPKNPDVVFNPMMAGMMQMKDIPSLRSRSKDNSKVYNSGKAALNAAEGDYANYLKDPESPNIRVDQQGIIDKYTMVSLGKSPTEAQLELAQAFPGMVNYFDLASGKIKNGQIVPKGIIDEMMRNMRKSVMNYGTTLKGNNATDAEAANLGGIDPARILAVPDNAITADSTRFANAPGMQAESARPAKISNKAEYDALPSGATYIGPSGHTAKKP